MQAKECFDAELLCGKSLYHGFKIETFIYEITSKIVLINKIKNGLKLMMSPSLRTDVYFKKPSVQLQGKRVVVSGATGGIGYAMVKRFIDEGANVLAIGRNERKLAELHHDLNCLTIQVDLTRVEVFDDILKQASELLGGIDCLVNNAGVSLHETFRTVTPEGFDTQVAVNLKAPFFLSQKVLVYMSENHIKGNLLFISSETGNTADIRPYGLTKVALNSFVQGLAYLYAKEGIRVNAIAPGVTATAMTGINRDNLSYPWSISGRAYLPEEIAEVATWLLSDVSGCISGEIITCNNGNTINARWK